MTHSDWWLLREIRVQNESTRQNRPCPYRAAFHSLVRSLVSAVCRAKGAGLICRLRQVEKTIKILILFALNQLPSACVWMRTAGLPDATVQTSVAKLHSPNFLSSYILSLQTLFCFRFLRFILPVSMRLSLLQSLYAHTLHTLKLMLKTSPLRGSLQVALTLVISHHVQ